MKSLSFWPSIRSKNASSCLRLIAEVELERRGDLRIVHPAQGVLKVKRPVRRHEPDSLTFPADDRSGISRLLREGSSDLGGASQR